MGVGTGLRRLGADDGGQTVVIIALLFAVLLGFAGLAIDGGRFYAERRYLQSAVDAAALGCAQRLTQGGTPAEAEARGTEVLTSRNLQSDPTGATLTVPDPASVTSWFNADGSDLRNLARGVVATTIDCRVAVEASMRTMFLQVVGLTQFTVPANAHAKAKGGMYPVVVNRYRDPPGPSADFLDYTKSEIDQLSAPYAGLCSEAGGGLCPDASDAPWDCTSPCVSGPETVILGQDYSASNNDFRGFIALDIRNFTDVDLVTGDPEHQYYNGITSSTATNTLKDKEAVYFDGGYPGPDLVAYIPGSDPVQKELQVAVMSGNSSKFVAIDFDKYFDAGNKILAQLFDGQVRTIPDFTIDAPLEIDATSDGTLHSPGAQFNVGANQRFRNANDLVSLQMVRDTFNNGTRNDTPAQLQDFTFTPGNPTKFIPQGGSGTKVTIDGVQVNTGLASGIYSVIIQGTGWEGITGNQLASHQKYVPLNVGGVLRDFAMSPKVGTAVSVCTDTTAGACSTIDTEAVFTFNLSTDTGTKAWNGSAVTVAADQGDTCLVGQVQLTWTGVLPACRAVTITASPDFTPRKTGSPIVTVRVPVTGLSTGTYSFVLRARGTNGDPSAQPVVHVVPLAINVNTSGGGATDYVSVQGYAVFVITYVDQNSVKGRAVTGMHADPNDDELVIARRAGLLPWEAAPCRVVVTASCP